MNAGELDDWLRRAAAQQRAISERALAELDLTPAQHAVLCVISVQPGISAAEVARIERLTPPTLSVIVGNLTRMKAVDKSPHPENARIQQLTVTELGADLAREGAARLDGLRRRLRATLGGDAEAITIRWLRAVAELSS